jgi:uncharacterized DUF497 family protein
MRFDWDPSKENQNRLKHGISFLEAITAFDDPCALIAPDPTHSLANELREWLIGESDKGVLVVVFTRRDAGGTLRLISARRASRKERRMYEEIKKLSV